MMKALILMFVLMFPIKANAQIVGGQWNLLHQFDGATAGDYLGGSVSGAGDVDGDGFADLIVGAPWADPGSRMNAGSAYVYSGATGALLWQFDGSAAGDSFGFSVSAAGDVDADGFDDLVVGGTGSDPGGKSYAGSAYVYSGATGQLILQFDGEAPYDSLGYSVSGAGDVNGDGFDDLIVGAPRAGSGSVFDHGSAFVYSGATGALIWRFDGQSVVENLGRSVSGAGDVNGDGVPDMIVGVPRADPGGRPVAGCAFVYSGANGARIRRIQGVAAFDELGTSVSGAGDVDGDGLADLIVGAPWATANGAVSAGSAYVHSGAPGVALLWQFDGESAGDRLGQAVSSAGDVDGDSFCDVVVGAIAANPGGIYDAGSVYLYSGATGALITRFDGQIRSDELGWSVSGAGDVNGDDFADVIMGAYGADPGGLSDAGSAYVWSLDSFLFADAQKLSATSGTPVTLGLDFPDSEAGAQYAILSCISGTGPTTIGGIDVPLTHDAMLQRMLIGWSPSNMTGAFGVLNVNGDARATITSDPILAPHIGKTYYLAAITYDGPTQTARLSSIVRTVTIVP